MPTVRANHPRRVQHEIFTVMRVTRARNLEEFWGEDVATSECRASAATISNVYVAAHKGMHVVTCFFVLRRVSIVC